MEVTVCVCTYGADSWRDLAEAVALPSTRETNYVIVEHGDTLHEARNRALAQVETEFVCFLDADDELESHFFDHIQESTADLRVPSVRYVKNGFDQGVRMPQVAGHNHACTADCLTEGNWCVIGTVAPTDFVRFVGGFRDFPVFEDWDLWLRCYRAGASFQAVPQAVYRAHVRRDSRNRAPSQAIKNAAHRAIAEANQVPSPV